MLHPATKNNIIHSNSAILIPIPLTLQMLIAHAGMDAKSSAPKDAKDNVSVGSGYSKYMQARAASTPRA